MHDDPPCMQTSQQYVHIYALYAWKEGSMSSSATGFASPVTRDLPKVDLYLRHSVLPELGSQATSVSGDSRLILLGCADGTVAALAWSGKVTSIMFNVALLLSGE